MLFDYIQPCFLKSLYMNLIVEISAILASGIQNKIPVIVFINNIVYRINEWVIACVFHC